MSLKSICIKQAYSSDFDNILNDFYVPVLEASVEYNRLAGFFSSTSLAIAARGILGLIKNGGILKLIVSPKLNKKDVEIIVNSYEEHEKYIEKKMLGELERLEDEFVKDHVFALGWMVANKKLKIKVAIIYNDGELMSYENIQQSGLFHQKVGILKDAEGNIITFSGSVNETASGWLKNIEEIKVFRSWEPVEDEYIRTDVSKFNRFWSNQSLRVKVMDIPHAVENKLIQIAPIDIKEINLTRWYDSRRKKIKLFHYQEEAVESWITNGMKGIFEMATGTGKTFTALGCLNKAFRTSQKILAVIASPHHHLIQQWKREIDKFDIEYNGIIIADSSNPSWKNVLADSLVDISLGYKNKIVILTTHRTFSSNDFVSIIQNTNKSDCSVFLIADEVHGLGSEKNRNGFVNEYVFRLGLSATPKRWFDAIGTNAIYKYFGKIVYEFPLAKAINTINPATGDTYLTPYRYIPKFVTLTSEELEEYIDNTRTIAVKFNKAKEEEKDKFLEILLFKRADIIKNATEKYGVLEEIINEIGSLLKWTIIYCSPQQIDKIMDIINSRRIVAHRFTMDEGVNPDKRYNGLSERDFILQKFAEGKYQVLVAMKCLDEGVDIPPARNTILMASSGNPREYIQRIGRVIRRYPGKNEAIIYDVIVIPSFENIPSELRDIEWRIFKKELKRYEEIAGIAINGAEALRLVYNVKNSLMEAKR